MIASKGDGYAKCFMAATLQESRAKELHSLGSLAVPLLKIEDVQTRCGRSGLQLDCAAHY
jgi:hypothetical protein